MRILLLGNTGQLGWELHRTLSTLGEVIALDYPQIDLAHPESLPHLVFEHKPQIIVNATAYTDVDKAEEQAASAQAINGTTPGILAESARKIGAILIHYSTDYVFDGTLNRTYVETDTPNPLGVYGKSKWDGERAVEQAGEGYLILRTSWVYSTRRTNYVQKVLKWARAHPVLRVVTDQIGNPTSARMLAEITAQMLAVQNPASILDWCTQQRGIYHLAGDGFASRFEFTQEILRWDPYPEEHTFKEMLPASTDQFPAPAQRPLYSALNCDKFSATFGRRLPPWQNALKLVMQELMPAKV